MKSLAGWWVSPHLVCAGALLLSGCHTSALELPDAGSAETPAAGAGVVDLKSLTAICISATPEYHEDHAAQYLRESFRSHLGAQPEIIQKQPESWRGIVALGRAQALASGLITVAELEAVKHDGFVVRAEAGTVAIAGYRAIGTFHGMVRFLERAGIRVYPGDRSDMKVVAQPPAGLVLNPFREDDKPFFEYRGISHLLRGTSGVSFNDMGEPLSAYPELFDPKVTGKPKDACYSDHTAALLVPKALYHDEHPEYYALRYGERIPGETVNPRLSLCMSNREVWRLSAGRALEWVEKQKDRRLFTVSQADDIMCQCRQCLAEDLVPYYYTDRCLRWVNHVAETVRGRYPDKRIRTLAYMQTVKPPRSVKPAPTVVVVYCPWYWNSRNDGSRSFSHARNITAMEELLGWHLWCPGNLGLYDYPQGDRLFLYAMAGHLKTMARLGAKILTPCGAAGRWRGLYSYVMARLAWDPFLDAGKLEQEYCRACFGPAAPVLLEYLAIEHSATERLGWYLWQDREVLEKGPVLLEQALALLRDDPKASAMLLDDILLPWYGDYADATKPGENAAGSPEFRKTLARIVELHGQLQALYPERHWRQRWLQEERSSLLASHGFDLEPQPEDELEEETPVLDRLVPLPAGEQAAKAEADASPDACRELDDRRRSVFLAFGEETALDGLVTSATQEDLIPSAGIETVNLLSGKTRSGVVLNASLSALPTQELPLHPEGMPAVHTGRFLLGKTFASPVDVGRLSSFEFHVWASADVPVQICLDAGRDKGALRAFVQLHAGEQIARVDLRNRKRGEWDYRSWVDEFRAFAIEALPQDTVYPFPEARDVKLVLFSITARNHTPTPDELPYRGTAVWLTQYRSNLSYPGDDLFSPYTYRLERPAYRDPGALALLGKAFDKEAFRTFTPDRVLTPISAIVTEPGSNAELKTAAQHMQAYLEKMCGVRLPIDPSGRPASPTLGNAIILGGKAGLASGRVTPRELEAAGTEGFMLRASDGRIAIAGGSRAGTLFGVARYLEQHGVRFFVPDRREHVPDMTNEFLREYVQLDRPYFESRKLDGGWKLGCQSPMRPLSGTADAAAADEVAERIKDCARQKAAVPEDVLAKARQSPLSLYVAAKMMWDPFADTSALVREYRDRR